MVSPDLPPANPFGGKLDGNILQIKPKPKTLSGKPTAYQFLLALFLLYVFMRGYRYGYVLGYMMLALVILETPEASTGFSSLLEWVSNPKL